MNLLRIRAVARKESLHIVRDWRTLGILVLLPVVLLMLFGYAIDLDVNEVRIAVYDADRSPESRRSVALFENTGYFTVTATVSNHIEGEYLLDSGRIDALVWFPSDFSRKLLRGETAHIHSLVDGSNPQIGASIVGLVEGSIAALHGGDFGSALRSRVWYNPRLESAQILIPGLIAMILVITAVISTAVGVSRERETGSMEQLRVSPLGPLELIIGKSIPYAVVSAAVAALVIVLGSRLFGVQVSGSLAALTGATGLFLIACLGLGLLVSTFARTQQVAFIVSVLVTFLPTFLLSGFIFPIRNMPLPIQNVSRLVPARYFLEALRGIMLKGGGFQLVAYELGMLVVYAIVTGLPAVRRLERLMGGPR